MALNQRKNFYIPVPRYASNDLYSPKARNSRTSSFETTKEDISPPQKTRNDDDDETKSLKSKRSLQYPSRIKSVSKTREEIKKMKMDMTFDNESGCLATRCDVVYKTILRDFRRYFLDEYKLFKTGKNSEWTLAESLFQFTTSIYPTKTEKECRGISLDLGCLLFPKEIVKEQNFLQVIQDFGTFGDEIETIKSEIMKIHGFLYKFSIDKIEECFQNISLSLLFLTYVNRTRETRIDGNPTMKRNSSIYLKARKILEDKASGCLSL
mmetsp:Transcript_10641/g.10493  ORF Transcript_10641/g.10493 Transcript_10641/m.10493 type:complete len:266 (-) Transcript_10641:34-831(-)|eukprot:CAMPEP_0197003362 /NCGR_PEP_ID=MMETSP1380-20130617/7654_1 /TAXON_ID=5936 /ORGANISM="Euplotes crassus, Strain CT5" /LENGTH=265 /DNA_ID=CAMNT_0042421849 /DNA_START=197 /DNA_END=994 /DNA_ORIENTATION=-